MNQVMNRPNIETSIASLQSILEKNQNLLFSNDAQRYLSELNGLKKNYHINIFLSLRFDEHIHINLRIF